MSKAPLLILSTVFISLFSGCLERFYPNEDKLTTGTLVINAHITDKPGIQHIEISRSGGLNFAGFDPVIGCYASLLREDGETRDFFQSLPGLYSCNLDEDFLQTGMFFQVQVITSTGNEYYSEFDKLRPVPEIDMIYYQVETRSTQSEGDSIKGIRFYIDFTYDDEAFEFIRWEVTETYEFHNPDIKAYIWPNRWGYIELPDSSNYKVCYITRKLQDIHSMPTSELNFGTFIKKPFNFIPNDKIEQKLLYKYSFTVRQFSIGPEAFHYWNELRNTSQEQGWLFDRQPSLLKSNICNINDESEKVLGFFTMSGISEIRGIAENIQGLDHSKYKYYCLPIDKGPGSGAPAGVIPAYFARAFYDGKSVFAEVTKHCVDCRAYKGSTHIKPEYW